MKGKEERKIKKRKKIKKKAGKNPALKVNKILPPVE